MDVSFESFANLVFRLGHPPRSKSSQQPIPPCKIFKSWLNHLHRPLAPGSGKHIFRLLFPHEGSRRRYGLKETRLATELEQILCVEGLTRWDAVGWGASGTGCLGKLVERVAEERVVFGVKSTLTLAEVDRHLDNLAAHSPFAQLSQEPGIRVSQSETLTILFRNSSLSPYALGLLVQIILRDLRPLLSPLPSSRVSNPTAMLRLKSTSGPAQLDLVAAMRCWDSKMAELYRSGMGDLDACAAAVEQQLSGSSSMSKRGPVVGVNVQIPKCLKGRSVEDALKEFAGKDDGPPAKAIWAETKYDGYRLQIHVEVHSPDNVSVTIFSKSKRNSTTDRLNTHAIILSALGLPVPSRLPAHNALWTRVPNREQSLEQSVILEAEVVPYNESLREGGRGPGIEEFWCLGAAGVTAGYLAPVRRVEDHGRHLCLFFFDILHLDGQSLLQMPLRRRRQILEDTISVIPGFSELSSYTEISLSLGGQSALGLLHYAFKRCQQRREGLVLKAPESIYTDYRWRWVKLKKDYIPNLGDCVDLVLVGAGWDMDRARELRVDTSVFTTFYIGTLTNIEQVKSRVETPHFEILFRVSYGPDQDALETINSNIRHGRWGTKPFDKDDPLKRRLLGLSWTYRMPLGMSAPSVLFERPLCAEVMGAGFQRIPGSPLYELRWPRLQKIWEYSERSWTEALGSAALLKVAHQSLGYSVTPLSPSNNLSPGDDSIRALWRSSSSIALTDIPEFPTPSPEHKRSGERMSPLKAASLGIKSSPPSTSSPCWNSIPRLMRPLGISRRLFSTGDISDPLASGQSEQEPRNNDGQCLAGPLLRPPVPPGSGMDSGRMTSSRALLEKKAVMAVRDSVRSRTRVKLKPLSLKSRIRTALKASRTRC